MLLLLLVIIISRLRHALALGVGGSLVKEGYATQQPITDND
jgi:hypothetical protein